MNKPRIIRNTDKSYPCVHCGSEQSSIIREDPKGDQRAARVKCNDCNGTYVAGDSIDAQAAGAIPDGPPNLPPVPEYDEPMPAPDEVIIEEAPKVQQEVDRKIPRIPSYVFISKDRLTTEFSTKKSFRKTLLKWETSTEKFDVFELTPKSFSIKIDI